MKFSKNSLLMSSMLAASVMAFSTTAAQAQDADNDEIVVTGSRLNVNPNYVEPYRWPSSSLR